MSCKGSLFIGIGVCFLIFFRHHLNDRRQSYGCRRLNGRLPSLNGCRHRSCCPNCGLSLTSCHGCSCLMSFSTMSRRDSNCRSMSCFSMGCSCCSNCFCRLTKVLNLSFVGAHILSWSARGAWSKARCRFGVSRFDCRLGAMPTCQPKDGLPRCCYPRDRRCQP